MKNPLSPLSAKSPLYRPCTEGTPGAVIDPVALAQLADINARPRLATAPRRPTELSSNTRPAKAAA